MSLSFEIDDDTVLRLSGVACAGYATLMLAAPRKCHDFHYELQARMPPGGSCCRCCPRPLLSNALSYSPLPNAAPSPSSSRLGTLPAMSMWPPPAGWARA